ncbi:nicotinamide riboside transporter PnuC [Zavarzinia sp. CC-PAN008]|uniref:nicotinamide riboside transporter PnuC n=1 Tax=Zavarzinia sp. CC-PAN008 TaxID=3243332 RepID=UPI003F742E90
MTAQGSAGRGWLPAGYGARALGRGSDWRELAVVQAVAAVLTGLYVGLAVAVTGTMPGALEIAATATGLATVYLVRRENVVNWPLGALNSLLFGLFFLDIGLMGQVALNLLFFLPSQFWGWHRWALGEQAGGSDRDLPVTWASPVLRVAIVLAIGGGTWLAWVALTAHEGNPTYPVWDASIVAASVVAQLLLAWKKVEAWVLWALPVNVSMIGLNAATGSWMITALYVLFLANALTALVEWAREARGG